MAPDPQRMKGCTVFLTGLSGAGKSTIAEDLTFSVLGRRQVTLLDGDSVRTWLSPDLGFSKQDRDLNIRRIGWVASEITLHGGLAVCAAIAPYMAAREEVRRIVEATGEFILVHVSTPLSICEERDTKGLYARARAGEIENFTGIDDPYERPVNPDIVLDTSIVTLPECTETIREYMEKIDCL
jgi:sulfate adenylyltransferase